MSRVYPPGPVAATWLDCERFEIRSHADYHVREETEIMNFCLGKNVIDSEEYEISIVIAQFY